MSNHWPSSPEEIRKAREEWEAFSEDQRKELRVEMRKVEKKKFTLAKVSTAAKRKPSRRQIHYTAKEWQPIRKQVFDRDGKICHICGGPATHIDHLLPKSKYPELALNLDNLKPACRNCNFEKLATVKEEYLILFNKKFR